MADDATPAEGEKPTADTPTDDEQVLAEAKNPDAVKRALATERAAAKEAREKAAALEARVQEFEDRDKSEQQKLEERATAAEKKAAELEAKTLRLEVGTAKGLPQALINRLQGSTQAELEADADELLKSVQPTARDFGGGARGAAAPQDMNQLIRQAAGR